MQGGFPWAANHNKFIRLRRSAAGTDALKPEAIPSTECGTLPDWRDRRLLLHAQLVHDGGSEAVRVVLPDVPRRTRGVGVAR